MTDAAQLPLDFEHRPSLSGDDFLVAPGNKDAVAWLDLWPQWPGTALAIHGPAGCGKTHLVRVFMARSNAIIISPRDLAGDGPPPPAPAYVIEDAENVLESGLEEPLLHLYNTLAEIGRRLLLTARRPPARWTVQLADLKSRLNAASSVGIEPPDDALVTAVLVKLFSDRQLRMDAEVVPFMVTRMERSFEAARTLVAAIDKAALARQRNVTVPLVRQVMLGFEQDH